MLCHLGPYITHCLSRLWLVGRCRMWRCSPQNIRELLTGPLSFSLFSGPVNQSLGFEEVVVTSCLFLKPSSSSFDGHTPTMVWAVRIGRRRKKNRFHKDNLRHLPRFPDFFVTSSWFSLHSWPVAGRKKEMLGRRCQVVFSFMMSWRVNRWKIFLIQYFLLGTGLLVR